MLWCAALLDPGRDGPTGSLGMFPGLAAPDRRASSLISLDDGRPTKLAGPATEDSALSVVVPAPGDARHDDSDDWGCNAALQRALQRALAAIDGVPEPLDTPETDQANAQTMLPS